jgi:hypothetical protein
VELQELLQELCTTAGKEGVLLSAVQRHFSWADTAVLQRAVEALQEGSALYEKGGRLMSF